MTGVNMILGKKKWLSRIISKGFDKHTSYNAHHREINSTFYYRLWLTGREYKNH